MANDELFNGIPILKPQHFLSSYSAFHLSEVHYPSRALPLERGGLGGVYAINLLLYFPV